MKQFEQLKQKVKEATNLLDGKIISRAKMLLKVDTEFLRRSLSNSQETQNFKKTYKDSIDALKLVSFSYQSL